MTDSDFIVFVVCIAIVYAGAIAQFLWGPDRTPPPRREAYYSWSKLPVGGIEWITGPHPRGVEKG
jgi:hypothetical protein